MTVAPAGGVKANRSAAGASRLSVVKATLMAGSVASCASTCTRNGSPVSESTAIDTEPTRVSSVFGVSTSS